MKDYILHHEWKIIEDGFNPELNRFSESIFSIGNGRMGQRANFEEKYSGDTLRGAYIAGIYYPDKTKVGWWKNGYPEYFAKIINSANWIGINVSINGQVLDLAKVKIISFRRELNMKKGVLSRNFVAEMADGDLIEVRALRFLSLDDARIGAIRYSVKLLNSSAEVTFSPYIDGDVVNEDSNYDEKFWTGISNENNGSRGYLLLETLKTGFQVFSGQSFRILKNKKILLPFISHFSSEKYIESSVSVTAGKNETIIIEKISSVLTSLDFKPDELILFCYQSVSDAEKT